MAHRDKTLHFYSQICEFPLVCWSETSSVRDKTLHFYNQICEFPLHLVVWEYGPRGIPVARFKEFRAPARKVDPELPRKLPECCFGLVRRPAQKAVPGSLQKTVLGISAPRPQSDTRKLPEGSFATGWCPARKIGPGSFQNAVLKQILCRFTWLSLPLLVFQISATKPCIFTIKSASFPLSAGLRRWPRKQARQKCPRQNPAFLQSNLRVSLFLLVWLRVWPNYAFLCGSLRPDSENMHFHVVP